MSDYAGMGSGVIAQRDINERRSAEAQLGKADVRKTPITEVTNLLVETVELADQLSRELHEATDRTYGSQPETATIGNASSGPEPHPISMPVGGQIGELQDAAIRVISQMKNLKAAVRRATNRT